MADDIENGAVLIPLLGTITPAASGRRRLKNLQNQLGQLLR
jgi:hypothetical protein